MVICLLHVLIYYTMYAFVSIIITHFVLYNSNVLFLVHFKFNTGEQNKKFYNYDIIIYIIVNYYCKIPNDW